MQAAQTEEKIRVIRLPEEPQTGQQLDRTIVALQDRTDCSIVLDFDHVRVITSPTLRKLMELRRLLNDRGQRLILSNVHPQTRGVFITTSLDGVFDFVASTEAAVEELKGGA